MSSHQGAERGAAAVEFALVGAHPHAARLRDRRLRLDAQPRHDGQQRLARVAAKAKAAGVILITIGFGAAATEGCERHRNITNESKVRNVLAAAASPNPSTGQPSTANSCTGADVALENADGDFFFCSSSGADLANIFTTAINSVSSSIKLIKMP
jgi:hypothetical protein